MSTYNLTNLSNVNTTLEFITAANDLTGDWWGRLFTLGVFLVLYLGLLITTGRTLSSWVAASFVAVLVSGIFYGAQLTGSLPFWFALGSLLISVVVLLYGGKST